MLRDIAAVVRKTIKQSRRDWILHHQLSRVRSVLRRKCAFAHGRATGKRRKGMRNPPRRRRFNYAGDAAGLIEGESKGAKKTGRRETGTRMENGGSAAGELLAITGTAALMLAQGGV
jgi:hypothetical protein